MTEKEIMIFDFSTKEKREENIELLFSQAKKARNEQGTKWREQDEIYRNIRRVMENEDIEEDVRSVLTEAFIQVESQIDPTVPEPEFRGRDAKMDSAKAKQREYTTKYVMHINDMDGRNTLAERFLKKHGDSFWKVFWNKDIKNPGTEDGEIEVRPIPLDQIYPDPTAKELQDCEYIFHTYDKHIQQIKREYPNIKEDLISSSSDTEVFDNNKDTEFLIRVKEFWHKTDKNKINCSIKIGDTEVKYIEDYWGKTQCNLFPFVHMWEIKDITKFWNISEIEIMLPLLRQMDKSLGLGLLNQDYTSNDVVLMDEGAMPEGKQFDNSPGAVNEVKQGYNVRRLGGLQSLREFVPIVDYFKNEIQRTTRNYDSNRGQETQRVTTASGLAQLRADAQSQNSIKRFDRNQGFKRLFELIDWTVLEFYNTDRYIYLGVDGQAKNTEAENIEPLNGNIYFKFNSDNIRESQGKDEKNNDLYYYPKVDVIVNSGDGIIKNKPFTAQVLETILGIQITLDNYRIVIALLEIFEIPQKQEITKQLKDKFAALEAQEAMRLKQQVALMAGGQLTPEDEALIKQLPPEIQNTVRQRTDFFLAAKGLTQPKAD